MPLTLCTQKEVLIELKLNGFFGVFLLHLDLEIFLGERGDEVKFYMRVAMY